MGTSRNRFFAYQNVDCNDSAWAKAHPTGIIRGTHILSSTQEELLAAAGLIEDLPRWGITCFTLPRVWRYSVNLLQQNEFSVGLKANNHYTDYILLGITKAF